MEKEYQENSLHTTTKKKSEKRLATRLNIGRYNYLVVESLSDFGVYLGAGKERVLLPSKYVSHDLKIGDALGVFVYTDSEDRVTATTQAPAGSVGDFVFLKVKDTASFGTFMDWGLEKDLLVPKKEQQDKMVPGKKYLIKICLDKQTQRVYGTNLISVNCDKNTHALKPGQQVKLLIHSITKLGMTAVVENRYLGILHLNETYQDLSVGDRCNGYITRLRDNKKIDLTLKKPGHTSIRGSAQTIVYRLNRAGGFIACHDKSSPEDIKTTFSMSKKEFKRAVGRLYKSGVIELKKNGIGLK